MRRLERRPGQKEDRFEHLLGGAGFADANSDSDRVAGPGAAAAGTPPPAPGAARHVDRRGRSRRAESAPRNLPMRVTALEAEVASLRAELASSLQAAREA